jgi:hypothetical protein
MLNYQRVIRKKMVIQPSKKGDKPYIYIYMYIYNYTHILVDWSSVGLLTITSKNIYLPTSTRGWDWNIFHG